MLNNPLNIKLNRYKHDFSIHDIDGICWWEPRKPADKNLKRRLVLFEHKHKNELFTGTQLEGFRFFASTINWEVYDAHSGFFLIRATNDNNVYEVFSIDDTKKLLTRMTTDEIYNWVSCKDMTNEISLPANTDGEIISEARHKDRAEFVNNSKKADNDFPTEEENRINRTVKWINFRDNQGTC